MTALTYKAGMKYPASLTSAPYSGKGPLPIFSLSSLKIAESLEILGDFSMSRWMILFLSGSIIPQKLWCIVIMATFCCLILCQ